MGRLLHLMQGQLILVLDRQVSRLDTVNLLISLILGSPIVLVELVINRIEIFHLICLGRAYREHFWMAHWVLLWGAEDVGGEVLHTQAVVKGDAAGPLRPVEVGRRLHRVEMCEIRLVIK